jgi:hypothetical protein
MSTNAKTFQEKKSFVKIRRLHQRGFVFPLDRQKSSKVARQQKTRVVKFCPNSQLFRHDTRNAKTKTKKRLAECLKAGRTKSVTIRVPRTRDQALHFIIADRYIYIYIRIHWLERKRTYFDDVGSLSRREYAFQNRHIVRVSLLSASTSIW